MRGKFAALILIMLLVACSRSGTPGPDDIYFGDDSKWYRDDKPIQGVIKSRFKNGNISQEASFKDGVEDGTWVWYYTNGQKQSEINYQNGVKQGLETHYYDTGLRGSECVWSNGVSVATQYWTAEGKPKFTNDPVRPPLK